MKDTLVFSRRLARIVAAAAMLLAVLEAIAISSSLPIRLTAPYTVNVDRQAGLVQFEWGLHPFPARTRREELLQGFLVQYVIARETYSAPDLPANFHTVAAWSADRARAQYRAQAALGSPVSPLSLYPQTTSLSVTVTRSQALDASHSRIFFQTVRRDGDGPPGDVHAYVATIAYREVGHPLTGEDEFTNPLGFIVTRYDRMADTASGSTNVFSATQP